ncbi:transglutaminase-like domain-containing protein [Staphylothermus hellenicus]|nr:transglutaminase family protein [Staphylothermus hellenicus]
MFNNYGFSINRRLDLENYVVGVKIYGNVTNLGRKSIHLNETDLFVFDYPLDLSDQRVVGVKAYVENSTSSYRIIGSGDTASLIIETPLANSTLKPDDTIFVGVEYNVSINRKDRALTIADFNTYNTSTLMEKAGTWDDIPQELFMNNTEPTELWNYTNPLIQLLLKYLSQTINKDKPLSLVLDVLGWFDKNIVYSTRIPPRHPWEVLVEGAGDCDDQSNLLITVLRAFKIPSYLEIGFIYISKNYYYKGTEANGYFIYVFKGGGGHGWVATYIPPWGWLRIDLTASLGKGLDHIRNAAFYILPTIVIERIRKGDYAVQSAKSTQEIEEKHLLTYVVLEMIDYEFVNNNS